MTYSRTLRLTISAAILGGLAACNQGQRDKIDSAAGAMEDATRAALAVIDVDMGRHVDSAKKISDPTDEFAPGDTIYASVHMSGTTQNSAVTGRWTGPDGGVVEEQTLNLMTDGDSYVAFYIMRPDGFTAGKYTLHLIIDGKEVRSKEATVM